MKIPNLLDTINKEEFIIRESRIANTDVILIQPEISAHWNKDNLIFRSSIWTKDGELVSAGFPKFFNYGEQVELSPPPTDISNAVLPAKIDGSLLIISKFKGEIIMRTRGTFDASIHETGAELADFKERYPKLFTNDADTWDYSVLIEWVTPKNQIILKYSETDFYLIGMVKHEDYSLATQKYLDVMAETLGMKRPSMFRFKALPDLLDTVKEAKGIEGLVIYTNNDQTLHKIKSAWYLALHRMKSLVGSFDKVYDVWESFGRPSCFDSFFNKMETTFDFEIADQCKDHMNKIIDTSIQTDIKINDLRLALDQIKLCSSRKEQALAIQKDYKEWQTYLFLMLNGKPIDNKVYKKIFFQIKG